ncbi:MAG TPA: response regulator transcription factor [Vicinamibacterales bacterium]|nr:response regulator transcription factor [Vicinamibacterales bacterium]
MLRRDAGLCCVGAAREIDALVQEIATVHPDLLLFDAQLRRVQEMPVLPRLHAASPPTKILAFFDALDEREVIDTVEEGAEGCALKAAAPEYWLHAMRVVLRGDVWIGRRLLFDALLRRLREGSVRPHPLAAKVAGLTQREREIVHSVQRGLSNKQIARRLEICPTTVKTHLQHIFGKLGISGRTQLLVPNAAALFLDLTTPA